MNSKDQAQQQLVHALLESHQETPEQVENYVSEALAALDKPSSKVSTSSWSIAALGGIAASVLLCVTVVFLWLPSHSAIAAIDDMLLRLQQLGDRHYRLQMLGDAAPARALASADVYLRGADQFVLQGLRLDGSRFIKGSNTQNSWQIGGNGQLKKQAGVGAIKLPVYGRARDLAVLNVESILNRLKQGYDIDISPGHTLQLGEQTWSRLRAQKHSQGDKGIQRVDVYFDETSFDIGRLVFYQVPSPKMAVKRDIVLDVVSLQPLPADFFEPQTHVFDKP